MIIAQELRFRYKGASDYVLDRVDCEFSPGQMVSVVGPSGCGKSTLLYLLGLLLTPSSGRLIVNGADVSRMRDGRRSRLRAHQIGFVFQDAALDATRSVLDNVVESALYAGISRRSANKTARQLLNRFGVELRSHHRPGEVSGGQAQRVGLCRALIKDPAILLADEPTGNLDAESARIVLDALSRAADRGATVVMATHDESIAARSNLVVTL